MKKLLTLFMCLALAGLYSCSSDDKDESDDNSKVVKVSVNVKYTKDNALVADDGATVYLFEDFDRMQPGKWEYIGDGRYKLGDKEQAFYWKGKTDANGNVVFDKVKKEFFHTIVIESVHHDNIKEDLIYYLKQDLSYQYNGN